MDHLGAATIAENRLDAFAVFANEPGGVLAVIGHEPASDFGAIGPTDDDRVTAREYAFHAHDADGQQALAAPKRGDGAGIHMDGALGLQAADDPFLARGDRVRRRQEPGAAAALR